MTVMCDGRRLAAADELPGAGETLSPGQAARELELRGGEFELAVQLGEIATVAPDPEARPGPTGPWGRRRVPVEEVRRLRSEEGFPDTLRERLRTVGATEAAGLLDIGPGRFLRLARAGCFAPARFYVNRYGVVVWLYLASELTEFADREPELLRGRIPAVMRVMLDGGQDWRGRKWRSRRVAQLMGRAADGWQSAAVIAAVLPPEELASIAEDPMERSVLRRLRPSLAPPAISPTAQQAVEWATVAAEFDEVLWYRVNLTRALDQARRHQPAANRLRHPTRPATLPGPRLTPTHIRTSATPPAPLRPTAPASAPIQTSRTASPFRIEPDG
ncbi:DUF6397 family protein [Streptomyces albofaciens]|uniref:DUF6397 family protein n=1 Tax=Streptomyces albofaciens TaxID=66866 RepID=UPI001AD652BB|nr:DUF6397 family protein [Streptomyces albofaciens]